MTLGARNKITPSLRGTGRLCRAMLGRVVSPFTHPPAPRARGTGSARRLKCQALVTPVSPDEPEPVIPLPDSDCRMVVRVRKGDSDQGQIFSALVHTSDDPSPDAQHLLLTMIVLGGDADGYLDPGQHFTLWRGHEIARGVVTRRLYL